MFIETGEVGFDDADFAIHKPCGTRLLEEWAITRTEDYTLSRSGATECIGDGGDDKTCEGVWCTDCDVQVTMRTKE